MPLAAALAMDLHVAVCTPSPAAAAAAALLMVVVRAGGWVGFGGYVAALWVQWLLSRR